MTTHKILVTGSRTWPKPFWVEEALADYMSAHWVDEDGQQNNFVVVHGACPSGADQHAKRASERLAATGWPVSQDPHPAKWNEFGRAAGFIRNGHMVSLGADVCLAFIHNSSNGATGCADLAKSKEIPVKYYRIDES